MNRHVTAAVMVSVLFVGVSTQGPGLVRSAVAAPAVDVAARKTEILKTPLAERGSWCRSSMRRIGLDRQARVQHPIGSHESYAQTAGNALFDNIAGYYAGLSGSAELIRDALAEGARSGAFTEKPPYSPPDYKGFDPLRESAVQVANFMVPLAHGYLILKAEYPQDTELLSSVKGWGNRLFEVTKNARDELSGRGKGNDRRALIAAGWAHWGGAANNRNAIAHAKRYFRRTLHGFGRGGWDRAWRREGTRRLYHLNMTVAAALTAAYALRRAGVDNAYTMAPRRGTIVEGAEWLWKRLSKYRRTDLLRTRDPESRSVAWIELFIREFPDRPSAAKMRAWRSGSRDPLYANMGGGPTTCLYRQTLRAS